MRKKPRRYPPPPPPPSFFFLFGIKLDPFEKDKRKRISNWFDLCVALASGSTEEALMPPHSARVPFFPWVLFVAFLFDVKLAR